MTELIGVKLIVFTHISQFKHVSYMPLETVTTDIWLYFPAELSELNFSLDGDQRPPYLIPRKHPIFIPVKLLE